MSDSVQKRQRSDFEDYTLNVNLAVDKDWESKSFTDIAESPVETLQGIAKKGADALAPLGVKTVRDLGTNKYYRWAKAIVLLSEKEEKGKRSDGALLNVDGAVMKEYEKKSLGEIAEAPVHALQGISEKVAEGLKAVHVKTVRDLAESKYASWAEAIEILAGSEQLQYENKIMKRLE